jgi:hypothetical protein
VSFLWLQIALSLAVLCVAAERFYKVGVLAPVSDAFLRALERMLRAGQVEPASRVSVELPTRWTSRVVNNALGAEPEDSELLLLDLLEEAGSRLGLLRLCATLASTLGLLGGILIIRSGFGADVGLLALEAGLAERAAIGRALLTMGIGVGTAAFAFAAHGALRRASTRAYSQAQRVERLVATIVHVRSSSLPTTTTKL